MRRNSEEELYLLRTHDMEEGSSHSDLSSSGECQKEEVSTAKQLNGYPLILNFLRSSHGYFYWSLSVMLSFVLLL